MWKLAYDKYVTEYCGAGMELPRFGTPEYLAFGLSAPPNAGVFHESLKRLGAAAKQDPNSEMAQLRTKILKQIPTGSAELDDLLEVLEPSGNAADLPARVQNLEQEMEHSAESGTMISQSVGFLNRLSLNRLKVMYRHMAEELTSEDRAVPDANLSRKSSIAGALQQVYSPEQLEEMSSEPTPQSTTATTPSRL